MNRIAETMAPALAPVLAKNQDRVLSLRFRKALGRRRQDPPRSFYDKIFWMSANSDTSLWTALADKIKVREYVAERCGEGILPELYATYGSAADIDFDVLPDAFAIKTNNGCASNYLVRSKASADLEAIRSGLTRWLRFPYGELTGQLHYAKIPPRILAEELLFQSDDPHAMLVDYKFYCFDGEPRYCFAVSNRRLEEGNAHAKMMYDLDWKPLASAFKAGTELAPVERPARLKDMIDVAARLSEDIPFVRVDLYEVDGAVRFSEMTFMPGLNSGFTEEFQRAMGRSISLPVSACFDATSSAQGLRSRKVSVLTSDSTGD